MKRFTRLDERNTKLFKKLNEKIDLDFEEMKERFQMFTEQFSRISNRLDRNDRLGKRLETLERWVKELQDKLSQ